MTEVWLSFYLLLTIRSFIECATEPPSDKLTLTYHEQAHLNYKISLRINISVEEKSITMLSRNIM